MAPVLSIRTEPHSPPLGCQGKEECHVQRRTQPNFLRLRGAGPLGCGRLGAWGVLSSQENKNSTSLMGSWSRLSPGLDSAAAENPSLFSQPHVFISVFHNFLSFDLFRFGRGMDVRKTDLKEPLPAQAGFPSSPALGPFRRTAE